MHLRQVATERDVLSVELKQQRDKLLRLQLQKEQLSRFLVHDRKNPVSSEKNRGTILATPGERRYRVTHSGRILVVDDEANARTALADLTA